MHTAVTSLDPTRHPGHVLVEETDPGLRLDAHLELGRRAMARSDDAIARTHFEEALQLDPTDERPKAELRSIGVTTKLKTKRWGFLSLFRR